MSIHNLIHNNLLCSQVKTSKKIWSWTSFIWLRLMSTFVVKNHDIDRIIIKNILIQIIDTNYNISYYLKCQKNLIRSK